MPEAKTIETIEQLEVTIKVKFAKPITKEQAHTFVNEMDYTIKDTTGETPVADTEVVADDIDD